MLQKAGQLQQMKGETAEEAKTARVLLLGHCRICSVLSRNRGALSALVIRNLSKTMSAFPDRGVSFMVFLFAKGKEEREENDYDTEKT